MLGLWGGTGGGKTRTALELARGIAGPDGVIGVVDTEGRRASYYADIIPGSFKAIDLDPPYTPERYVEAIQLLERNCAVGVIDSASHAWEGPDGVLDLHEQALDRMLGQDQDNWQKRASLNWPAWREPKARFKALRNKILAVRIPLIVCFRGDLKSRMVKGEDNRNSVVKDETTTPIFDTKFIYEMHVAVEVYQQNGLGGYVRYPQPYAKTSHPQILAIMPKAGEQLTGKHGENLAKWCAGGSVPGAKAPVSPELRAAKKKLWDMTEKAHAKHAGDAKTLEQWLWDETLMSDTETLETLTLARLAEITDKIAKRQ